MPFRKIASDKRKTYFTNGKWKKMCKFVVITVLADDLTLGHLQTLFDPVCVPCAGLWPAA